MKSPADRALLALGGDPAFVSDVLGDLREEYEHRLAHDGFLAAGLWYVREIARSTPHLIWSAVRHGSPAARARLAGCVLALVATCAAATVLWLARNGPPARLVAGAGTEANGIVVNNLKPVQLAVRVLDAAGHRLERKDVRYRLLSGTRIPVSASGVLKCTERGDAIVQASVGTLSRNFVIHCEPVKTIRGASWGNFVVNQPPRPLEVDAIGPDGEPVTLIAAALRVEDSTVATLDGGLLRPLRPGSTHIDIAIGDDITGAPVTVFEQVSTFEGLRPDQRWVAAPIELDAGASLRFALPTGLFFLAFGDGGDDVPIPRGFPSRSANSSITMSVAGPIMCMPELRAGMLNTHCLARASGAMLTISNGGRSGSASVVGFLALDREQ